MESKASKRKLLYSLLGDVPGCNGNVTSRKVKELNKGSYVLEVLLLDVNATGSIPAYIARPNNVDGKMPVVLFNHSHGGNYHIGKKTELIQSSEYLQKPSYAEQLTSMGYGVLCIDMLGFGERRGKTEGEIFKEMLWKGQVMWGMMIYETICGIDYLHTRNDVDSSRIATLGMSMGGLMAWWVSALDERIKVCIDIASQVDAEALIESRGLDYHGFYYYVPSLLKYFRTSDIQRLIAPRYHLSLAGNDDKLTPYAGLGIIDEELKAEYTKAGFPERWKMIRYDCGHIETEAMRAEVCSWLEKNL